MTAEELHSRIASQEDFTILGQSLLPLRIGHVELLAKLGCEFPSDPGELALAVLICAMEPSEVMPFFRDPDLNAKLAEIASSLGEWDFVEKLKLWNEYWDYNTKLPTVVFTRSNAEKSSGIPFVQSMRVVLLSRLGYRPAEIANTEYLQALWDIATLMAQSGQATICSEDVDESDKLTEQEERDLDAVADEWTKQQSLKTMEAN